MKYLLDTNACVRYINGRSPQLRLKITNTPRTDLGVSAITTAELFYGSAKSQTPERSRERQTEFLQTIISLPFNEVSAVTYASLRVDLERVGTPIGQHDMLIAAIALTNDLILITHNRETMSRAGVLYGVTMGSDGASRLLSIVFEEAVKVAK
ncbi:MAG: PIN domain-containing protein [Armatimonadetes bacterium]|nr:PIN domain-containing protein [Anaerolineae bacterium]